MRTCIAVLLVSLMVCNCRAGNEDSIKGNVNSSRLLCFNAKKENGKLVIVDTSEFILSKYDEKNRIKEERMHYFKPLTIRCNVFTYDSIGNMIEMVNYDSNANIMPILPCYTLRYTFDNYSREIKEEQLLKDNTNSGMNISFKGDTEIRALYLCQKGQKTNYERDLIIFDKQTHIRECERFIRASQPRRSRHTGFQNLPILSYTKYDNAGRQIEYWTEQHAIDETTKYNHLGNETKRVTLTNGKQTSAYTYKYVYDIKGNWIKKTEYLNGTPDLVYQRIISYR
jgi:hypothetical protein